MTMRSLFVRMSPFIGGRVLEIGCGGGQFAKLVCDELHPSRYVGFEVRDRLLDELRENPPPNFEYVLTAARDARYNRRGGSSVEVPCGEFDTVLGKSWMTHVTLEVLRSYAAVFSSRLVSGGHMVQTCFVDEERAGEVDGRCLHTFYSIGSLEFLHGDFEFVRLDAGGWQGGDFGRHDVAVWRRR